MSSDMRNSPKNITCIIPAYNESERILDVLNVITKVGNVAAIICVDDGSTDNTADVITDHYKEVQVLRLEENHGKAGAVLEGVKAAITEYIMLIDADLHNLNPNELYDAIEIIQHDPTVDMLVLRRIYDPWLSKLGRGDILVTGERIMRKKDLLDVYKGHPRDYQIEMAINYYMMDHKKVVYWVPFSGITEFKINKVGVTSGLWRELKMYNDVVSFGGYQLKIVKAYFTFCTKRYPQSKV